MPGNLSGTIVGATWATADDVSSYNHRYGFSKPGSVYIPSLSDGTLAADGSAITNQGGYVHNVSECSITQSDTYFTTDNAIINFWSADALTLDDKTYAQLAAHPNGLYNLWLKFDEAGFVELGKSIQYDLTKVFTEAEHNKNARFFGGTPIGGINPFT